MEKQKPSPVAAQQTFIHSLQIIRILIIPWINISTGEWFNAFMEQHGCFHPFDLHFEKQKHLVTAMVDSSCRPESETCVVEVTTWQKINVASLQQSVIRRRNRCCASWHCIFPGVNCWVFDGFCRCAIPWNPHHQIWLQAEVQSAMGESPCADRGDLPYIVDHFLTFCWCIGWVTD